MSQRSRNPRGEDRLLRLLVWGVASFLAHVVALVVLMPFWTQITATPELDDTEPIRLVILQPDDAEEEEEEEEPEPDVDWSGQLVDLPEPIEQERPDEADYLAEHSRTVEKETRTRNVRVNPEVLTETYSPEDRVRLEELVDLGYTEDSTGAKVGNDRFDPDRNGSMAALPSPYKFTNRDGVQAPAMGSFSAMDIRGAPNNDALKEEIGDAVHLNSKEFLYATYINHIRRLVNFYWNQNLENLGGKIPLAKPNYTTVVNVRIRTDGSLAGVDVTDECGSPPLDGAVVDAFKVAGPFPPPPEGLLERDGLAYLDNFGFEVRLGQAKANYEGIDPRSGVQFPGILKAPR